MNRAHFKKKIKAGDNGIKIEGNSNTVENCILRYNGDTGLQISKSTAAKNTIKYGVSSHKEMQG